MKSTRRRWLSNCLAMVAWPEVLSAQRYASAAAKSPASHFETLDAETAGEIEAIAVQIIPSTGGPGAREAGVIYFIDRALATFEGEAEGRATEGWKWRSPPVLPGSECGRITVDFGMTPDV